MDQDINKPKVSVILPVYNGAKYVKQAIESVLRQTFSDFELIIINDGSTDGSLEIIKSSHDPRIKIVDQENKGLITTLNTGIALSRAEHIARIDADDIWSNQDKLSRQMNYISQNPDCAVLGTWANIIDEDGNKISRLAYPKTDREIRSKILTKCCFVHPSVIFNKIMCEKAGGFNGQERYIEDYGLWLRMGQFGKFANIPEYLMSYRINKSGITQQKNYIQSQNSLAVIKNHKTSYPNYMMGYLKWNLKLFLLKTIGLKNINRLKK
jgi:glycosyltransferase involved in cell wall biosynthesis